MALTQSDEHLCFSLPRKYNTYVACNMKKKSVAEQGFFTSEKPKKYHAWSCQNVCDAVTFLLDNIFI